jgi:tetrahydromethanopterin S-methyltransferase subunit H
MGLLANMTQAIRHHCGNPATVIITLDADDCLIGDQVLDTVCAQYNDGADVTVGTMLRTDKQCDYPVSFATPRNCRGGNVWQHLRTFRKRLFDAIPDAQLRQDGCYIDLSTDWAFMLPIVEIASQPRHIQTPLYLHEPSGRRDAENKIAREAVIARLVALPPLARQTEPSTSGVT